MSSPVGQQTDDTCLTGVCVCVRLHFCSARSSCPPPAWDARSCTITIPAGLNGDRSEIAVRAVLSELGVPQPQHGALCWCGEPVTVAGLSPALFAEVINIGA